jgi:hypothetical protein
VRARVLAARETAEIQLRRLVHVVDVPLDVFARLEASSAVRALLGVRVRFEVSAEWWG